MALTLKDYLHLDSHHHHSSNLITSQSKIALAKISAIFNAVKNLPFNSKERLPSPRALSKRLSSGKFWKKRPSLETAENVAIVRVRDIVRQNSFGDGGEDGRKFPVVMVRSYSSSSSESEFDGFDRSFTSSIASRDSFEEIVVDGEKCSSLKNPNSNSKFNWEKSSGYSDSEEEEDKEMVNCESEDEEEQLSPVSVMDFPTEKEEGEEGETTTVSNSSSPSFHQTLANIERSKLQLLDKITRFESLAMNIDHCFEHYDDSCSSNSNVEPLDLEQADIVSMEASRAWALLGEIKRSKCLVLGSIQGSFEKLLIDFFVEGLSYKDEVELLDRAKCWIVGNEENENGQKLIREMERNGKWRCFDEEVERMGVDLEGIVLGSLLEELVVDFNVLVGARRAVGYRLAPRRLGGD